MGGVKLIRSPRKGGGGHSTLMVEYGDLGIQQSAKKSTMKEGKEEGGKEEKEQTEKAV